ncbi:MAG: MATE family efflux transporter [Oscillospiraceae bacterium]|jgi:putative MATE family efflux protein|nr:MATE family efflux transporter [Oscillospiraceae bacterium]
MEESPAIATDERIFTNRQLASLLIPLLIEQVLNITIGMADTVMVAGLSEAAISAVSLVDQFNQLLMQLFNALATGGAVLAAQYIGRRDRAGGCDAARQLVQVTLLIALIVMAGALSFSRELLRLIYGDLEESVMAGALRYFRITNGSIPFFALYAAGAALFRSMGNSKVSLYTSILMNIINVAGNYVSIYHWGWGVSGAAAATFLSRICGAAVFIALIIRPHQELFIDNIWRVKVNMPNVKRILRVGIPNGLENSVFQVGKLVVLRLVASLGTSAVAANAICNTFASIACMPGSAVSLALVTVVGQCVGARAYDEAKRGTYKLMLFAIASMAVVCAALLIFISPAIGWFGQLSVESRGMATRILTFSFVISWFTWPFSFTLPNALRGAGDAKVTMIASIVSMMVFRVAFSYLLADALNMGLDGVWYAMYIDWIVRSIFFVARFASGKWKTIHII